MSCNIQLLGSGMNSPAITKLFRQLFTHQTCSRRVCTSSVPQSITVHRRKYHKKNSVKTYRDTRSTETYRDTRSTESYVDTRSTEDNWQQRTSVYPPNKMYDYERYPMINANALRKWKKRPRRVKMLMRDFIEGSLCVLQLKSARTIAESRHR